MVVLDIVSTVHHGGDVLLLQYLQVAGSSLTPWIRHGINTNNIYDHRLTYKDTAPGLGFEDDVHWIVDSVEPFFILIDFLCFFFPTSQHIR